MAIVKTQNTVTTETVNNTSVMELSQKLVLVSRELQELKKLIAAIGDESKAGIEKVMSLLKTLSSGNYVWNDGKWQHIEVVKQKEERELQQSETKPNVLDGTAKRKAHTLTDIILKKCKGYKNDCKIVFDLMFSESTQYAEFTDFEKAFKAVIEGLLTETPMNERFKERQKYISNKQRTEFLNAAWKAYQENKGNNMMTKPNETKQEEKPTASEETKLLFKIGNLAKGFGIPSNNIISICETIQSDSDYADAYVSDAEFQQMISDPQYIGKDLSTYPEVELKALKAIFNKFAKHGRKGE